IIIIQLFFVEIFQTPFGKRHHRSYGNLALDPFSGCNPSTKIPSYSIHFDSLMKKLLKIGNIHDSIFCRVSAVKSKLQNLLLSPTLGFLQAFFMGTMTSSEEDWGTSVFF
ncbi:unnamed protein product, partial [Gulo gulo]